MRKQTGQKENWLRKENATTVQSDIRLRHLRGWHSPAIRTQHLPTDSPDELFFEDPLALEWSESWMALRRATRLLIMTGENMELAEWAIPFLQNQAVDIFQPDIINSGGIAGVKMIADLVARYRIPIALHNVSGLMLNMASQQLAAAVFNCPRIECAAGTDGIQWATKNPISIKNGYMEVSNEPGLGVELNQDFLKANRAEGEPWWG
jgi:L-alanine-DL-glutamate epimerase-like enolase superfamily enzyme